MTPSDLHLLRALEAVRDRNKIPAYTPELIRKHVTEKYATALFLDETLYLNAEGYDKYEQLHGERWGKETFEKPTFSPFGPIHHCYQVLPGIPAWEFSTSSHGGYMVEAEWAKFNLSWYCVNFISGVERAKLVNLAGPNYYFFEEDQMWSLLLWDYYPFLEEISYQDLNYYEPAQFIANMVHWHIEREHGYYYCNMLYPRLTPDHVAEKIKHYLGEKSQKVKVGV
jgi:hypothetical protein